MHSKNIVILIIRQASALVNRDTAITALFKDGTSLLMGFQFHKLIIIQNQALTAFHKTGYFVNRIPVSIVTHQTVMDVYHRTA